jgi:hypothetical protein
MNFKPSPKTKNALIRGLITGFISLTIYLLIVVFTTPNLTPLAAINAALKVNWIIIFGLSVGVGSQIYVSSYGTSLGCSIANKKKGILGSSGSTAISSFFSFFSLVSLGCCGSWLVILSFLPSVFGSAFSVALIQYSKLLSYLGLLIVLGYSALAIIKLKTELKRAKIVETKRKYHNGEYV